MAKSGGGASNPRGAQLPRAFRAPLLDGSGLAAAGDGSISSGLASSRSAISGECPIDALSQATEGTRPGRSGLPTSTGTDGFCSATAGHDTSSFGVATGGAGLSGSRSATAGDQPRNFGMATAGMGMGSFGLTCGDVGPGGFGSASSGRGFDLNTTDTEPIGSGSTSSGGWYSGWGLANMGAFPGSSGGGLATTGMWSGGPGFTEFLVAGLGQNRYPSIPDGATLFPGTFPTPAGIDKAPLEASSARSGGGQRRAAAALDGVESAPVQGQGKARKRRGKRPLKETTSADTSDDILDLTEGRSLCSGSDMDDSGSDDEWRLKTLALMRSVQNNLFATALVTGRYYMIYYDKNEHTILEQSGLGWMMETLRKPRGSQKMFRMDIDLFYKLHDLLVSNYGLQSSTNISSLELLAMFLVICGHGWSNSAAQHIFKHSSETISRKFGEVLDVVVAMCKHYIRPIDPNFSTTHSRITGDRRMMPRFKDCIGAIDGTHITAVPNPDDFIRYIGRSGKPTQNVMAVVDFDLRFTYASIGQPGSMHDTNVLFHALEHDKENFPHPPKGKYYLVDAGYPNQDGYLAPYKGERYHVPDWKRGLPPGGEKEKFNHLHSSIRNAVERTFAVWKMKWRILLKMPSYPMDKQKMIVAATMCLHNYICENTDEDKHFLKCDRNPDYIPTIPQRYARHLPSANASDTSTSQASQRSMNKFRDDLAGAIFRGRSS